VFRCQPIFQLVFLTNSLVRGESSDTPGWPPIFLILRLSRLPSLRVSLLRKCNLFLFQGVIIVEAQGGGSPTPWERDKYQ